MNIQKIFAAALLSLMTAGPLLWADTGLSRGSTGLSEATADGRYGSLAGEAGWGGTQDFSGGTLLAAIAAAANEVMTQGAGDARYPQLAAANTFTKANTFNGDVTLGDGAEDTVESLAGLVQFRTNSTIKLSGLATIDGTTWDFATKVDNVTVPNANAATEAINQQTGDARYAELTGHVITGAHTVTGDTTLNDLGVNDDTTLGNAVGDFVYFKAGNLFLMNPTTLDVEAALEIDATGWIVTLLGSTYDFTGSTNVTVPDANAATEAMNQQTGDARYVAQTSVKSGTVAGGSFAGNPKIFTVTFGTAFPDANYAVTITAEDNRTFTFQTKLAGSFVMNSNANLALVGNVDWTATAHNDP